MRAAPLLLHNEQNACSESRLKRSANARFEVEKGL